MKIVVTGHKGFIGSRLVSYLRQKDYKVVGFDIRENRDHNISKYDDVALFLEEHEPDIIYHTAAQSFLTPGEKDPHKDMMINIWGMINLLQAIEKLDINPVLLYTSTGAVYGLSELPHKENMRCRPACNYGISKLAAELYLQKWSMTQGIEGRIVRFSSVYGHHRSAGPVNIFCGQALAGGPITVYGSGAHTRDMIHVDDVLPGMERVVERGRRGHVYNLGTGEEHSVNEVAHLVNKYKPVEISYVPAPMSMFDLPRSWFDIKKICGLGWKPQIDLEQGIQLTLNAMERQD